MKIHHRGMTTGRTFLTSAAVVGTLFCSVAHAQNFSLAPTLPATAGQTITFYGTISNPASGVPIYITGGDVFGLPTGLSADVTTSDLFNDTYFQLQPGDTYSPTFAKSFFTVAITPGLAPGLYTGFFDLDGGSTASSNDILGTQQFTVTVTAPEPSQIAVLGLGILGMGGLLLCARKRRAL